MEWYVIALISALFSAIVAILEKKILFKQHPISFTFLLSIFNLIFASFFLFSFNLFSIGAYSLGVLLIKSILNAFAFLFVIYSIKNLELSECLPLLVLTPGLIAIFGFLIFGEVLILKQIGGLCLLIIGIYVLGLEDKQKFLDPFRRFFKKRAYLFVFAALLLFTITSLMDRFILTRQKLAPEAFMFFQHAFYFIIFLLVFLFTKEKAKSLKNNFKFSLWLILALAVVTMIYRYAEILAVKGAPATALAIVLKRVSVFFAVIIGGKLFNERNILRKAFATIILIVGAVLVA
jgi:transporter family protein